MKIKISYLPEEKVNAERIKQQIRRMFPPSKIKDSDQKSAFLHCYIDTNTKWSFAQKTQYIDVRKWI